MRTWHTFALLVGFLTIGCGKSHTPDDEPIGGEGVCCPISDFSGCNPGIEPLPGGGWAPRRSACDYTIRGFDGYPFVGSTDARGCPILIEDHTARHCGPDFPDSGPFFPDAGPLIDAGTPCNGLGAVACLAAPGCTPRFDDACCPSCFEPGEPAACADCFRPVFHECAQTEVACSLVGISCGITPNEYCLGDTVDCTDARPTSEGSCDRYGCIPAYPSGEGAPNLEDAICVPISAESCTTACRRLPPPCPRGTVPEGDGSCYTDRCIPSDVCE